MTSLKMEVSVAMQWVFRIKPYVRFNPWHHVKEVRSPD